MSAPEYLRLPGSARAGWARHSLWLGSDHLLSVEDYGIKQRYRRFAYADIQTIRIRPTRARGMRLILLVVLCLGAGCLFAFGRQPSGPFSWLSIMAVMLLVMLREILLGPCCASVLYSRVSKIALPSLSRLRAVNEALPLLTVRVQEAQLALPSVTLQRRVAENLRAKAASAPTRSLVRTFTCLALFAAAWACVLVDLLLISLGGQRLANTLGVITLWLLVISIVTAATSRSRRSRASAIAGLAAGVVTMSGLWLTQLLLAAESGFARGLGRVEVQRLGAFAELGAAPLERDVMPWLTLVTALSAALLSALHASRALFGTRP